MDRDITKGNIGKQILFFFFPILFGAFFQQLYNTTDAIIVGRFVSKTALAAVGGTTGTIINLFVGFFIGISSGFAVIISQHFGAKDRRAVSECVHTAITFAMISGVVFSIVGFFLSEKILLWMGVPDDIFTDASVYLKIYFLGMIFNLVYNMGAAIFRGVGDSRTPLLFLIVSCIANIFLDILFVVIFGMGIFGVGLATVLCQLISAILVIVRLARARDCYRLFWRHLHINFYHLQKMIGIGMAAGFQSVSYTGANIIVQSKMNILGTDTIAAWAAYGKIDSIYWMTMQSLGISLTTFAGQNFGAGKKDRVKKSIFIAYAMGLVIVAFSVGVLHLYGRNLLMIFTNDAVVLDIGNRIALFLSSTFILYVSIEVLSGIMRGIGDTWIPMLMSIFGISVTRIIWLFTAFEVHRDIKTVLYAYPISWGLTSVFFIIYAVFFSKLKHWLQKGR